jgi:hypothetical protein
LGEDGVAQGAGAVATFAGVAHFEDELHTIRIRSPGIVVGGGGSRRWRS